MIDACRWAGIAKGVGVQKIIGRVHVAQVEIEKEIFVTSFSVLEDQTMDMLLGLDMLKRHQCTIDLQHNVLRIGTTGTETNFLPENELPTHSRLTLTGEDGVKAAEAEMKATADALEADEIRKAIERSKQEGKVTVHRMPSAGDILIRLFSFIFTQQLDHHLVPEHRRHRHVMSYFRLMYSPNQMLLKLRKMVFHVNELSLNFDRPTATKHKPWLHSLQNH